MFQHYYSPWAQYWRTPLLSMSCTRGRSTLCFKIFCRQLKQVFWYRNMQPSVNQTYIWCLFECFGLCSSFQHLDNHPLMIFLHAAPLASGRQAHCLRKQSIQFMVDLVWMKFNSGFLHVAFTVETIFFYFYWHVGMGWDKHITTLLLVMHLCFWSMTFFVIYCRSIVSKHLSEVVYPEVLRVLELTIFWGSC